MPDLPMSCSGRIVKAFLVALEPYPDLADEVEQARRRGFELPFAAASVHELVERWVRATSDPDLGLRAGKAHCFGAGGALDYALHTAETLYESTLLAQRFAALYSDDLEITIVREQQRASIQIGRQHPPLRALTDFMLATWYRNHLHHHLGPDAQLECFFTYARPISVELHESTFGTATLTFGAAFDGFSFDGRAFDRPLESADSSLHALHCEQLERLESSEVLQESFATRVRQLVAADLEHGRPTSHSVARRLRMSRRTLVRRLADESTCFSLLLDDLRRQLALHLIVKGRLSLYEMATLLGFSHVQAFHRSFKRWTGSTPCRYRQSITHGPEAASEALNNVAPPAIRREVGRCAKQG
jgi:AraC-like DNA-binding protein